VKMLRKKLLQNVHERKDKDITGIRKSRVTAGMPRPEVKSESNGCPSSVWLESCQSREQSA
jgi:hypothetical protein